MTTTAVPIPCEVCGEPAVWYTVGIVPNGLGMGAGWLAYCDKHRPRLRHVATPTPDAAEDGAQ